MNKNIVIAIIAVIVIAAIGFFVFSQPATTDGKINTEIKFLSPTNLKNGDQVQIELKDTKGTALAGQKINITYNNEKYSVITDNQGKGFLVINGEEPGQYNVTVDFNGTDKYNGCSAKTTITIEDGTSDAETNTTANATASTVEYNNGTGQSSSSSSATPIYYDAELNVYYDANGTVIGGQSEGSNIYDLRNNQPVIVNGSLV